MASYATHLLQKIMINIQCEPTVEYFRQISIYPSLFPTNEARICCCSLPKFMSTPSVGVAYSSVTVLETFITSYLPTCEHSFSSAKAFLSKLVVG